MKWREWDDLPEELRIPEVREYYDILSKKKFSLKMKRGMDIICSIIMLAAMSPVMIGTAVAIAVDSRGGVFYRQSRVTQYGKVFRIHKFRTMVAGADKIGTHVTVGQDSRITRVGELLRKYRLDELPQLIDVLSGNMSFVGTRPEAVKYVEKYTPEMMATLLLPAGITSEASLLFKDEAELLDGREDVDKVYVERILPEKMKYNLDAIRNFSLTREIKLMFKTVIGVVK